MGALREPRVTASSYTLLGRDAPSRLLGGEPSFAASRSSARQCFHLGSAGMQMRAANAGGVGGIPTRTRLSCSFAILCCSSSRCRRSELVTSPPVAENVSISFWRHTRAGLGRAAYCVYSRRRSPSHFARTKPSQASPATCAPSARQRSAAFREPGQTLRCQGLRQTRGRKLRAL